MQRGQLVDLATDFIKLIGTLSPTPPVDDEGLRQRCIELLTEFKARAARVGYGLDIIDAGRYALVSLIDERVLAMDAPIRAAWAAAPLQIHLFNTNNADVTFFERVTFFRQPSSAERADVLELFHLCLCLGFKGRYSDPAQAEARNQLIVQIANDVRAARGGINAPLSPAWQARGEANVSSAPTHWRGLPLWAVPAMLAVVVLLWWLATSFWTSAVVERFVHDFAVH